MSKAGFRSNRTAWFLVVVERAAAGVALLRVVAVHPGCFDVSVSFTSPPRAWTAEGRWPRRRRWRCRAHCLW